MNLPIEAVLSEDTAPAPLPFVREVASLYHRNAWLFLTMLLPAAVFGYLAVLGATERANDILRYLPHGPERMRHIPELLESAAFRVGGFLLDWLLYLFAFAGISVAVRELVAGNDAEAEECLSPVRERLGAFLGLSVSLWLLTALAFFLSVLLSALAGSRLFPARPWTVPQSLLIGFVCFFPGLLIVSRFGLAIPALILEKCNVKQSFFRSDELTEHCWTILALLLVESVGGSYLAYMFPQWLASVAITHGVAPWWIGWAALVLGLLLGVLLQPHLLVGFALLYIRRSAPPLSHRLH
jgi:hypothetical protein